MWRGEEMNESAQRKNGKRQAEIGYVSINQKTVKYISPFPDDHNKPFTPKWYPQRGGAYLLGRYFHKMI